MSVDADIETCIKHKVRFYVCEFYFEINIDSFTVVRTATGMALVYSLIISSFWKLKAGKS